MKWIVVIAALAAGCKSEEAPGKPGPSGQTMKDAMTLLCDAAEKAGASGAEQNRLVAVWIDENVRHPEARQLVKNLGTMDREKANAKIRETAKAHGVERCPYAMAVPALTLDLPAFAPDDMLSGGLEYIPGTPLVTVTQTAIAVEGTPVVALTNGVVDPTIIIEGTVPAITKAVLDLNSERAYVALEKTVPFATMHVVWSSIASRYKFLVAKKGSELHVLPIGVHTLRDPPPESFISMTKTEIVVTTKDAPAPSRWAYPDAFGMFVREMAQAYGNPGSGIRTPDRRVVELTDTHTVEDLFKLAAPLRSYIHLFIKRSTP